jgi:membrane protease YdiL (CAAX protease family)
MRVVGPPDKTKENYNESFPIMECNMKRPAQIFLGFLITIFILVSASFCEMQVTSTVASIPSGLCSQVVFFIMSSVLIGVFSKKRIISFSFQKISSKKIICPILITIMLSIFGEAISLVFVNETHLAANSMSILQILLIIVVLASVSEELLFRGFFQNMLEPLTSFGIPLFKIRLSLPVIMSGIFFGIIHFGMVTTGASINYAIQTVIFAMILGMIAGYYQEKYENFSYAIVVHMTANVCGLLSSIITS